MRLELVFFPLSAPDVSPGALSRLLREVLSASLLVRGGRNALGAILALFDELTIKEKNVYLQRVIPPKNAVEKMLFCEGFLAFSNAIVLLRRSAFVRICIAVRTLITPERMAWSSTGSHRKVSS